MRVRAVGGGRRRRAFRRRDDGSMAVEVVLMTPVLVLFMLFVVALGRMVWIRGEIEAATRDAVRAAALERSHGAGFDAAAAVVDDQVTEFPCPAMELTPGAFTPGATITFTMTCRVSYESLGLLGLPGGTDVTFSSDAPLDEFRRAS
jgi:Flp pilus assembly protein TadG